MVDFLKNLCTDYHADGEPLISENELNEGNASLKKYSNPDNFLHHFFKKTRAHTTIAQIAKSYVKFYFIFDALSVIPLYTR